jgi:predicted phosphodiesterase
MSRRRPDEWRKLCQEALDAWEGMNHSRAAAAEMIGIPSATLQNRLETAHRMGLRPRVALGVHVEASIPPAPVSEAPAAPVPAQKPRYRVRADGTVEAVPDDEPLATRDRLKYEDEIGRLRRELKAAHRHDLNAEQVREQIIGISGQSPEPPDWTVNTAAAHGMAGVPVTIWSDWHWGEVVRPEEVGGVNAFDMEIARARARRLVERTVDICFSHTVGPEYPGIVICLGGDMISGDIHDELRESNEMHTAPTLVDLQGVLIWALTEMADRFGKVFVPCVVGNHGRMTAKPRAKGRVHTSFEWLMYVNLCAHFRDDERVTFFIPNETDAHFRVNGTRYMLTHGDSLGVKGGDGIIGSLGPIMRGGLKTSSSEAQIGRELDVIIMGHWHQYLMLPESGVIVNGALKGYDEYARLYLRAKHQPPIQALWFDHPKRGITSRWPVLLEDRQTQSGMEWISWRTAA